MSQAPNPQENARKPGELKGSLKGMMAHQEYILQRLAVAPFNGKHQSSQHLNLCFTFNRAIQGFLALHKLTTRGRCSCTGEHMVLWK